MNNFFNILIFRRKTQKRQAWFLDRLLKGHFYSTWSQNHSWEVSSFPPSIEQVNNTHYLNLLPTRLQNQLGFPVRTAINHNRPKKRRLETTWPLATGEFVPHFPSPCLMCKQILKVCKVVWQGKVMIPDNAEVKNNNPMEIANPTKVCPSKTPPDKLWALGFWLKDFLTTTWVCLKF